jgi:hypothetical protein
MVQVVEHLPSNYNSLHSTSKKRREGMNEEGRERERDKNETNRNEKRKERKKDNVFSLVRDQR